MNDSHFLYPPILEGEELLSVKQTKMQPKSEADKSI